MTEGSVSAAVKALEYAEKTLGVHAVHESALVSRSALDDNLNDLSVARDKKRAIEALIQDEEMEIVSEERSKHPEMSQAQMDKHVKVAFHGSPKLRELRDQHTTLVSEIEGLEFDKIIIETDIKIAVARLHELGGYFEYLAAIKKQAGYSNSANETSTS